MAVHHISDSSDFDKLLSSSMYVLTDFYADWCGPCKAIAGSYGELAGTLSVPGYLAFAKVDIDKVTPVASRFQVTAVPTFMFFKNGKQVAVNGHADIRGADLRSLKEAATKLGRLAAEKRDAGVRVGE